MSTLTTQQKGYLQHLAKEGDMVARAIVDNQALLAEIAAAGYGPVILARFATTANINLSTTHLTAIDGVTPVAGDIALVKNQSTASQNGLYVVSGTAAWTRLVDNAGNNVIASGMIVSVSEGTANLDTLWTLTTNAPITVGTTGLTFAQFVTAGVSSANLASNANGLGASLVGIEDAAALITATTVEAALAELVKYETLNLADPGTGQAIPVTRSAYVGFTIGSSGAETNTLAIPTFLGQKLILNADTVGTGTRAVTVAQAINQAGNTVITFDAARDFIELHAIKVGGAFRWTVASSNGVALS